jgi:hypothetical protein
MSLFQNMDLYQKIRVTNNISTAYYSITNEESLSTIIIIIKFPVCFLN